MASEIACDIHTDGHTNEGDSKGPSTDDGETKNQTILMKFALLRQPTHVRKRWSAKRSQGIVPAHQHRSHTGSTKQRPPQIF